MDAVCALSVAQARGTLLVLGAVEHDDLAVAPDYGGIEGSGGFPGSALRSEDGSFGNAAQRVEGKVVFGRLRGQKRQQDKKQLRSERLLRHQVSSGHPGGFSGRAEGPSFRG